MRRLLRNWPLWPVLAAQAVLTVPWLWRTAPFTDEALYLKAGHAEWEHWLNHSSLPHYASWFSGAPVIYPPLGAAANSAGGLVGARCLSLLIMLGATATVYLCGCRLFGDQTAFFAAAIFAVSGLVVHNGAFATYNPLALFFLALATWTATLARDGGWRSMVACIGSLVLANATKYATLGWDPIVVGIIILHGCDKGIMKALGKGLAVAAGVAAVVVSLLAVAGPKYVSGLETTTLFRTVQWGLSSPAAVLWRAFAITGIFVVPAALGIVQSLFRNAWPVTLLLSLLTMAALIAPLDQARIHELSSLDKNVGFGLVFVAVAAGYAISTCIDWAEGHSSAGRIVAIGAGTALILATLVIGRAQSVQFRGPSRAVAARIVGAIRQSYRPGSYILVDNAPWMEKYYLPDIPARAWTGVFSLATGPRSRIDHRICAGLASVVILRMTHGAYIRAGDNAVRTAMENSDRYKLTVATGQGNFVTQVWQITQAASTEVADDAGDSTRCP
jgi:hypothetical protein